jgi:asparagine synthase (glutamine-hydrolysing)
LRYGKVDHETKTMLAGIERLPAGSWSRIQIDDPSSRTVEKYWDPDGCSPLDIGFDEAARRMRELFLESVQLHLRSDVPLGVALSGGIDSSAITSAIRHFGGASVDLRTFSYLAREPGLDEEQWVDIVVGATGATSYRTTVGPNELIADLDELIRVQGEPFGSTSIYAQHRVFRLAAENGVKVMLDGQGADELLAGYRPYLASRYVSLLREGHPVEALRFLRRSASSSGSNTAWKTVARAAAATAPEPLVRALRRFGERHVHQPGLNQRWIEQRLDGPARPLSDRPLPLSAALREEIRRTSLPALLRYEDRNSMAFSIESRVPFLTPQLAELALGLPDAFLISDDGTSKAVFRAAMRGLVPDAILDRRDKVGFATPEHNWLLSAKNWVEGVLGSEAARNVAAIDVESAQAHWMRVLEGRAQFDWRIWRLLNLIKWSEIYHVRYE